jgi:hypothetical protein
MAYKRSQLSDETGKLHLIDCIARDLYQAHSIVPPSIHTELYYAQKMANNLRYEKEYDLADALEQRIWDAAKWGDTIKISSRTYFVNRVSTPTAPTMGWRGSSRAMVVFLFIQIRITLLSRHRSIHRQWAACNKRAVHLFIWR